MSLFDSLIVEIECPETREVTRHNLQIFFRDCYRDKTYHIGDKLDNIPDGYNNVWIRNNYVCYSCSKKTLWKKRFFIKTEDQKRHDCYINIEDSTIVSVLSEKDFKEKGLDFVEDR